MFAISNQKSYNRVVGSREQENEEKASGMEEERHQRNVRDGLGFRPFELTRSVQNLEPDRSEPKRRKKWSLRESSVR